MINEVSKLGVGVPEMGKSKSNSVKMNDRNSKLLLLQSMPQPALRYVYISCASLIRESPGLSQVITPEAMWSSVLLLP